MHMHTLIRYSYLLRDFYRKIFRTFKYIRLEESIKRKPKILLKPRILFFRVSFARYLALV